MEQARIDADARAQVTQARRRPAPAAPASALLDLQRRAGNRAVAALVQRAIATTTESVTATRMDGVTQLTALIGARPFGGRGTNPTLGEPGRIQHVGPLKGRYVGGHMLNQEMGGLGDWDNMIVQSEDSNKNMNLHDNLIKRLSDTARRIETYYHTGYEYGVRESITVNPAAPSGAHNHAGEQHVPASLNVVLSPVMRPLGRGAAGEVPWPKTLPSGHGHGEAINNPYSITNVPPYPVAVVATAPGISSRLADKARRERKAKALAGKRAHRLRTKHFKRVEGIGATKAKALRAFFKANAVGLDQVVPLMTKGVGFTKRDIEMLRYYQLK